MQGKHAATSGTQRRPLCSAAAATTEAPRGQRAVPPPAASGSRDQRKEQLRNTPQTEAGCTTVPCVECVQTERCKSGFE